MFPSRQHLKIESRSVLGARAALPVVSRCLTDVRSETSPAIANERGARRVLLTTVCGTSAGSKVVVLGDDSIVAWFGASLTDRGPGSVGTAAMAFGWDALPVDYRDDELEVVGDGDDLGVVDLDDLRYLDAE